MPNEFDFINWIKSQQTSNRLVQIGIGDDLAVLNWPDKDLLLVGVDQVLDGVHFDSRIHSPREIGRKAMNRNLSDCAAMACLPAAAMVSVTFPVGIGDTYCKDLYSGIKEAGDVFDCPIVGGDTASWTGKLLVSVTIIGRSEGIKPVQRKGAKVGDGIYVTGALGGSIRGRHMSFEPRVELARHLAKNFSIHAMADLSDGLARDLKNICLASNVGAVLTSQSIPVHADVFDLEDHLNPIAHSMGDGEDYELLIISPQPLPVPCVSIGYIQEKNELELEHKDSHLSLPWSAVDGWEHTL